MATLCESICPLLKDCNQNVRGRITALAPEALAANYHRLSLFNEKLRQESRFCDGPIDVLFTPPITPIDPAIHWLRNLRNSSKTPLAARKSETVRRCGLYPKV